jgi:putative FmdB family regulatory protein
MPRYEHQREACGRTVLRLWAIQHDSAPACPECGSKKLTQLITSFQRRHHARPDPAEAARQSAGDVDASHHSGRRRSQKGGGTS